MPKIIVLLLLTVFSYTTSADQDAMIKYKDYTPQALAALPTKERKSVIPMVYNSAANKGISKGVEVLFKMQLNRLMYPAIENYALAVKQYQRDLGDKVTGILTVSQIYHLEKRSEFQKLSRVYFPQDYRSFKTKTVASVQGTMMIHDERIAYPVNHTILKCYKIDNYCELDQLFLSFPKTDSWGVSYHVMKADTEYYDITGWDENTIDAAPTNPGSGCRKTAFNLNFKTKEFYQITRNGDKPCEINGTTLPKLTKPRVAQIVDGEDIFNKEFSNLNKQSFQMLSKNFQQKINALIESEKKQTPQQ